MTSSSPSNAEADLATRVKSVLGALFAIPPDRVDASASPDTIPKWDSHGHLTLVLALEEEFGVQFTDTQIYEMLNFDLIVLTLKELLPATP
jgi:acyl carrier protein